jgi:hypothetical protein
VDKDLRLAFRNVPSRVLCGEHARRYRTVSFRILPTTAIPRRHLKRLRSDHRQLRYVSDPVDPALLSLRASPFTMRLASPTAANNAHYLRTPVQGTGAASLIR